MKKIPILIDTDPGVDDFFCIALGCMFQERFDLKAVTTIGGNNLTDVTTRNALNILKLFHREDVPVARGNDSYLAKPFGEPVARFHGANGIGNVILENSDRRIDELAACDKIYETALSCDGELVLVTVGPETNLALAFLKYPDLKKMIRKIVVMGGSLTEGNVTAYAEANIYHDVKAAKIVFESGIPIDMIGLNVTREAPLKRSILDQTDAIDDTVKDVVSRLIEFRNEESMHDAIAISSLLDDQIIGFRNADITIIDDDKEKEGMTHTIFNENALNRAAVNIDVYRYYELMKELLRRCHFN